MDTELTAREAEVLTLAMHGKTNWEISCILKVSNSTVKVHLRHSYAKLGAHNRVGALAKFMRLQVLDCNMNTQQSISPWHIDEKRVAPTKSRNTDKWLFYSWDEKQDTSHVTAFSPSMLSSPHGKVAGQK